MMINFKNIFEHPAAGWTALAGLLVLAALLVPASWLDPLQSVLAPEQQRMDSFDSRVARVDNALQDGRAVDLDESTLSRMLPLLQARRLSRAGPMTAEDMRRATDLFRTYKDAIRRQENAGSQQALRTERNRRLAGTFPRLDPDKIDAELDRLRRQIDRVDD